MTSLTFGLDVRTVPKIEPNHLNEMVVEGETSVFRCFVSGVPTPAISWFHNGKPLEINEEVNSPYKISQAQSCKFGQLSSGFSNGLSAQLSSAQVHLIVTQLSLAQLSFSKRN
jgi:hypothetical protein